MILLIYKGKVKTIKQLHRTDKQCL